jgi:hypothetical protein
MATGAVSTTNLDMVNSLFNTATTQLEQNLSNMISQMGQNPSQADLQAMQIVMVKWQTVVQLQSNVIKATGDSYKAVVNNVGQ